MISSKELFQEISNQCVCEGGEVVGYFVKNSRMNLLENLLSAPAVQAEQLSGNTEQVSQPDAIDANLVEALRLVQCMLEDYRERNYGDAERWIRHINDLMSDYSEAHGDDAYSVLHGLLPAAPNQEAE